MTDRILLVLAFLIVTAFMSLLVLYGGSGIEGMNAWVRAVDSNTAASMATTMSTEVTVDGHATTFRVAELKTEDASDGLRCVEKTRQILVAVAGVK